METSRRVVREVSNTGKPVKFGYVPIKSDGDKDYNRPCARVAAAYKIEWKGWQLPQEWYENFLT